MAIDTSKSDIVAFYKDKNVFITGASGFLGRLLVEKLLRVCAVKKLYILVRSKKGTSPRERLQSIFQVPLMDKLRSVKPDFMDSIELVEGDCSLPNLGIKDDVRVMLLDQIQIVFHGAATVNFEEPLKKATAINVCGSRDIANLCQGMKNLTEDSGNDLVAYSKIPIIFGGDFNLDLQKPENSDFIDFMRMWFNMDLKSDSRLPTTRNHTTIDLIFTLHRFAAVFQAFVHVSTAFCHCPRKEIKETFYDAPLTADNLIKLSESLNDDQLSKISSTIMAEWPNTYAFTKAVAEDAIKKYASGLPACVFRPAIVVSTIRDPIEGWIDNLYGPSGIIAGCGAGLIRVVKVDPCVRSELVPADMCVNGMMAAAYKTSLLGSTNDIPIYNFTPSKDNPQTFGEFYKRTHHVGAMMPPMQAVWYLTLTEIASPFWFTIFSFLIHTLPAFIIDAVLVILQKKPQALKIYRKIHKFLEVLAYFATRQWDFHDTNLQALLNGLNKTDRQLFDFDMKKLNWDEMALANSRGIRKFIMKESESNIPAGLKKMFFLHILHRIVQLICLSLIVWFTTSVLSPVILTLVQ